MHRPASASAGGTRLSQRSLREHNNAQNTAGDSSFLTGMQTPSGGQKVRASSAGASRPGSRTGYDDRYGQSTPGPKSPKSEKSSVGFDMLGVKLDRKRAESDLQLLANRIALLKLEEQKALNKVNETKQRADEILAAKKRNQETLERKMRMQKIKNDEIEAIRRKALQEKEERREKLNATRQTVYEAKRASAIEAKSASRQCGDMASSGKNYSEIEKRRKAEEERKRKEALRQQKEIERQEREHQAQLVYMKKMEEEAKRKKEAEDMIRMLEEEEKNLISRLRRTQQMQEEAFQNLKKTLES